MDFPINIHLDEREISTHLVMELLAIFIGFRYYLFVKKRSNDMITSDDRWKIFVAVCFGALLGSRLVGVLEDPYKFYNSPDKFVFIFSNKTIIGGLLGGLWCVEFVKKRIGVSASSGDMMTYPLILGLIIGRIGCFCEGIDDGVIGAETSSLFGVNFGDNVLRHPLPLYEIVFLISLWVFIFRVSSDHRLADGAKFKLFMINYLLFRFFNEFLKENEFTFLYLSTIQIATLVGIIYYYRTIINPRTIFADA